MTLLFTAGTTSATTTTIASPVEAPDFALVETPDFALAGTPDFGPEAL